VSSSRRPKAANAVATAFVEAFAELSSVRA
jgi:hypothetical protein